jgi:acyl-CoA dehydrogenase
MIEAWLARCPDASVDPVPGMAEVGLLAPVADYATIARLKAAIVARTGLLGVASVWGGRHLVFRHFLSFGTDAQRAAWARRALAVGISEPNVGAHPKLLTTRAERTEIGYRITGEKAWVSNGPTADAVIVFAITDTVANRKRYGAFIVPRGAPGLAVSPMPGFHALRPSEHCLLTLDGVEVAETAALGEPGTAYERMALPFRDIEDAVGTFSILGALRYAAGRAEGADATELGGIVALTAVFAAGAEAVVAALDAGRLRTGDATLVGLRVLAEAIVARLKAVVPGEVVADLEAVLGIARGPRLARQTALGRP